mgnify:CR=1 FL=1
MELKRKIIRSIYTEIQKTFKYSLDEAEVLDKKLKKENTKAKDVPFRSFMAKRGTSLQYSMAMLYLLKRNDIKAYLGEYKGEGDYSDEEKMDYAFVVYRDGWFRWFALDFEYIEPKWKVTDQTRIPIRKYRKIRGKIWIYNPYDEKKGNLPFFGTFQKKYNWKF